MTLAILLFFVGLAFLIHDPSGYKVFIALFFAPALIIAVASVLAHAATGTISQKVKK